MSHCCFLQVLQCFHTFCQACLEKVQDHPDRVSCPHCHNDTPLGSGGVAGLLSDYGMTGLLEAAINGPAVGGVDFGATFCTGCKSRESAPAVARCLTCANFLCPNCVMAHKVKLPQIFARVLCSACVCQNTFNILWSQYIVFAFHSFLYWHTVLCYTFLGFSDHIRFRKKAKN